MACEEFRDTMLDVLYGEAAPGDAGAWDAHQRGCAPCRDELRALRGLRRELAEWRAPAGGVLAPAPPRRRWLAAAAAVVVASGAALLLAGTEVRVADGGATIRIGRPVDDIGAALRAQEERHRREVAAALARAAAPALALEDVQRLIRESEARQVVLIDAGLRELAERADAQRRQDLAQISAGLSYVEGRAGLQAARTTELMGHVLQAAQRK